MSSIFSQAFYNNLTFSVSSLFIISEFLPKGTAKTKSLSKPANRRYACRFKQALNSVFDASFLKKITAPVSRHKQAIISNWIIRGALNAIRLKNLYFCRFQNFLHD